MENKGHGFIADIQKPEDYQFGGITKLSGEILQPTGQWGEFLPQVELQVRNGLETMNCTVYGTLNCIEALLDLQYGIKANKSERYIGILAETSRYGNSPQKVIETIRKKAGLIDEVLLPFNDLIDSWEKYYSPKPMVRSFIQEGEKWLGKYKVGHEWVRGGKEALKESLKRSPLGVSVNLQRCNAHGIYEKRGPDNHWVMLYGYKEGEYWKIFDHYDDVFKKMAWDYGFEFVKRYSIEKAEKQCLCQKVIRAIKNYFFNELIK